MKKTIIVFILFAFCLILTVNVLGQDTTKTYVDNDKDVSWYDANHVKTIQEGIDNITTTGIVNIWDSVYYVENISINKPVSLVGNGTSTTHLEYTNIVGGSAIMHVKADNINISGLHFNNSLINNNQILNDNYKTGNYTHIFDCLFTNATGNAINLEPHGDINAHNLNISNNEFYNITDYAITSVDYNNTIIFNNIINGVTNAITLYRSYDGEISYNNITNSFGDGQICLTYCTNILIHHNILKYGLWTGICFDTINNSYIYNNTIIGFNETGCYGIELYDSFDNIIYNNYFLNDNNVYDATGSNTWSITKTLGTNIIGGEYLGGNYWSDYTGEDNTGDGLGDTELPYDNSGEIGTGGDYLPLTVANLFIPPVRLTEQLEKPTHIFLAGLISIILLLGLLLYVKKSLKEKTFNAKIFIEILLVIIIINIALSFI